MLQADVTLFIHTCMRGHYIMVLCKTLYTRACCLRIAPIAYNTYLAHGQLIFRKPEASKGHLAHLVLFVFAQKPTNFGLWRTVCEPFADCAAQVRSPIHTYAHLVGGPFGVLMYVYEVLYVCTDLYRSHCDRAAVLQTKSYFYIRKYLSFGALTALEIL